MNRFVKTSEDGSPTIYNAFVGEHYHSLHGALTESLHVYVNQAFAWNKTKRLKILEVGFGTGLNAFLTLLHGTLEKAVDITYHAIELYPLEAEMVSQLAYANESNKDKNALFQQLHTAAWGVPCEILKGFVIEKTCADMLTVELSNGYDVVYFDAFSPERQPELWSYAVFRNIYEAMAHGAVLTTYCAKGDVKRVLRQVGFTVSRMPGPPGKRHMLRAIKE